MHAARFGRGAGMAIVLCALRARGDDGPAAAARDAYDRAARAYRAEDYSTAAQGFGDADRIAPNDAALEYALRAALRATDPVLAMTLAERARLRERFGDLSAALVTRFGAQVGRLALHCEGTRSCTATVDGQGALTGQVIFAPTGRHLVVVRGDTFVEERVVDVAAGRRVDVGVRAPTAALEPLPRAAAPSAKSTSSTWFWVAAGGTLALGAAATVSGVDTLDKHSQFDNDRTDDATAQSGRHAQLRTNLLLAGTGVALVASVIAGISSFGPSRSNDVGWRF